MKLPSISFVVALHLFLSTDLMASAVPMDFYQDPENLNTVDLHAHPFMKQGLGIAFRGDFFGPIKANSYDDKLSQQMNIAALKKSGLRIMVASLYAHPLLTFSLRESIRNQIQSARRFVKESPDWVIATDPKQALKDFDAGKKILILAIEGAVGIVEDEKDFKEFIDEGGVRIITPLHLSGDKFGDVAFIKGAAALFSPFAAISSSLSGHKDHDSGVPTNKGGMHEKGKALIRSLLARKVWLDLAHASDKAMDWMIQEQQKLQIPLLYTHGSLRKYWKTERGISQKTLAAIGKSQGLVGLMISDDYLGQEPFADGQCSSGIKQAVRHFNEIGQVIGAERVHFGADYNGAVVHFAPSPKCPSQTPLDEQGFYEVSQLPLVWQAMRNSGTALGKTQLQRARLVLETWALAWERSQ